MLEAFRISMGNEVSSVVETQLADQGCCVQGSVGNEEANVMVPVDRTNAIQKQDKDSYGVGLVRQSLNPKKPNSLRKIGCV